MNRISKKWMVGSLVVMAAVLAGCGGSSGPGSSTEASAASKTPTATKSAPSVTIGT